MNLLETFQFEVMSSRIIVALRQRYLHGGGLQWVLSEPLAIVFLIDGEALLTFLWFITQWS